MSHIHGNIASPNPTYPQNIEVVTGTQEVKVSNINKLPYANSGTYTHKEVTHISNGDGTYIINGTATGGNSGANYVLKEPYTIQSGDYLFLGNTATNGQMSFAIFEDSSTQISYVSGQSVNNSKTLESYVGKTITQVRTYLANGNTLTNFEIKPMIVNGSTATDFVKHQEQTQVVSLGDIELCKIGNYQDYFYKTSGKNLFDKDNSSLIFNGFPNASTNTLQTNNNARTICLPCEPNTTYTISKVLSQRFLRAETSSNTIQADIEISNVYGNAALTEQHITTSANAKYILIFYYLSTADTLSEETIRNSIMINLGSTALPYEPYGSGKWYKKEYIGKYTFTGNETIDQFSSRTNTIRFSIANVLPTTLVAQEYNYNAYCNYLKAQDIYNNDVQGFFTHFNGSSATRIYIGLDKTIASTSEQAKTWLGNVKPILYYQLRTPSDIEITNETLIQQLNNLEKLKSYNGVTNISSSGNLSAILGISAIKGES